MNTSQLKDTLSSLVAWEKEITKVYENCLDEVRMTRKAHELAIEKKDSVGYALGLAQQATAATRKLYNHEYEDQ